MYSDSRIDYLLDLYCYWCGAQRGHLTNNPVKSCPTCGADFGLTNVQLPAPTEIPIRSDDPSGTSYQQTLFHGETRDA